DYKMRDGFCCPVGPWALHYWSPHRLQLSRSARATLFQAAVLCIEQLMHLTARRRVAGAPARSRLTAREIEVLRLYSLGSRPRQIAHHLDIAESTVREHLKHVQKKLEAKNPAHAVMLAIRGGVIATAATIPWLF